MAAPSTSPTPAQSYSAAWLASRTPQERERFLASLTQEQAKVLLYDWPFWARPNQLPPAGEWTYWMLMAGRGFGKTRSGAEWVIQQAQRYPGSRGALVARTAGDVRDVLVEGVSGIMGVSPPWFRPTYEPSKRRLTWPNGTTATTFSGDQPDALRGPQHHWAWADELAAWRYADAWDQLQFGLRMGEHPQCVVTTTPRPIPTVKDLLSRPDCMTTRGSTYDNRANLAPSFYTSVIRKYEGTRLGRQELLAELLDDNPGALWQRALIEANRVRRVPDGVKLTRICVGVDPEASSDEGSAETGIIVVGLGSDGHGYVLDDCSMRGSPAEWGSAVATAYFKHRADRIIAEANNGGDMVEHTIRTVRDEQDRPIGKNLPVRKIHASRSKEARAEPVSALAEQGRIHHVGSFPVLEDQLCEWVPRSGAPSPDRLDAMVWAATELMVTEQRSRKVVSG